MSSISDLQRQIDQINARNKRVEIDKAWETSLTRKFVVIVLTYLVVMVLFLVMKLPNPFVNAVIPSAAFVISNLSIPIVKKWWVGRI